ncbi:MAG: hypothetical protein M1834_002439 [Cirrosporium novae-zelandiae]|nr:MAG: hypothetical protein M1834_002439 [Cirrosporium novae-zelandiae]
MAMNTILFVGLQYYGPLFTLLYFFAAITVGTCAFASDNDKKPKQRVLKALVLFLMSIVLLEHLAEAILLLASGENQQNWIFYTLCSALLWLVLILALTDAKSSTWYPFVGSWVISIIVESTLIGQLYTQYPPKASRTALVILRSTRIAVLLVATILYFTFPSAKEALDAEHEPLLGSARTYGSTNGNSNGNSNGDAANGNTEDDSEDEEYGYFVRRDKKRKAFNERLKNNKGNWWSYVKRFSVFVPYMWPTKSKLLQLNVIGIGLCLLAGRALNVLIPNQLGAVTNALVGTHHIPWFEICLYVFFRWIGSGAGIGTIKEILWLPIQQYQYLSLNTAAHSHVMSLSGDYHNSKSSADTYYAIRNGAVVTDLLETFSFSLFPVVADLVVAFAYLYLLFGAYMGLIVLAVGVFYIWSRLKINATVSKIRRGNYKYTLREYRALTTSISSWTTVVYNNRLRYEEEKVYNSINEHMKSQRKYRWFMYAANFLDQTIVMAGLWVACFLAASQVVSGEKSVGNFVTLLSFWTQLTGPLGNLASTYNQVTGYLIDTEQLLLLMLRKPSVADKPGVKELDLKLAPTISFKSVKFSYKTEKDDDELPDAVTSQAPEMETRDVFLHDGLTFDAPSGKTVALVGETGSGKSTITKLLFRFYDVDSGSIQLDHEDIRDFTLESMRETIGVVPQDPELFNESIYTNVKYSRLDATNEEVHEACKAAAIHDKIMTFPKGYRTKVGEHGVKVSGGEKQRIAIARAILKNPKIIILDEATSAVDTETEFKIQEALDQLTKDRTTFIVAHRLSTVMKADLILVLQSGEIIERGNHHSLIKKRGKYYDLWSKQTFIEPKSDSEKDSSDDGSKGKKRPKGSSSTKNKPLKPDAPEFVPGNAAGGDKQSSKKSASKEAVEDHLEATTKTQAEGDEQLQVDKPNYRRPHYDSRAQSKSEPSFPKNESSEGDGSDAPAVYSSTSSSGPNQGRRNRHKKNKGSSKEDSSREQISESSSTTAVNSSEGHADGTSSGGRFPPST